LVIWYGTSPSTHWLGLRLIVSPYIPKIQCHMLVCEKGGDIISYLIVV